MASEPDFAALVKEWRQKMIQHLAIRGDYNVPPDNPFVGGTSFNGVPVNPGTLLSLGVHIELISVIARPDLSDASPDGLERVGSALAAAPTDVSTVLGDRAKSVAVFSSYPTTLAVAPSPAATSRSRAASRLSLLRTQAGPPFRMQAQILGSKAATRAASRDDMD